MKFFLILLAFFSFFEPSPKRQIIAEDYNYDFYILLDKDVNISRKKVYTWYKNGAIHTSKGGVAGYLLNGEFTKSYVSGAIAEQGYYNEGLKEGKWVTWYVNGIVKTTTYWKKGVLSGKVKEYSDTGKLTLQGKYSNGIKKGTWINFISKDTLKFKGGELISKKKKPSLLRKVKLKERLQKLSSNLKNKTKKGIKNNPDKNKHFIKNKARTKKENRNVKSSRKHKSQKRTKNKKTS